MDSRGGPDFSTRAVLLPEGALTQSRMKPLGDFPAKLCSVFVTPTPMTGVRGGSRPGSKGLGAATEVSRPSALM